MDCPYTDAKCGRHAQCKACLVESIGSEWGEDFIKALQQTDPHQYVVRQVPRRMYCLWRKLDWYDSVGYQISPS